MQKQGKLREKARGIVAMDEHSAVASPSHKNLNLTPM